MIADFIVTDDNGNIRRRCRCHGSHIQLQLGPGEHAWELPENFGFVMDHKLFVKDGALTPLPDAEGDIYGAGDRVTLMCSNPDIPATT